MTAKTRKTFAPSSLMVLDPIHPTGPERARVFVHANAAPVWTRARIS